MKQKNIKGLISEYFIFLIFIALVVVLTCLKPSFIAPTNLVNILKQASINGILAFGMMFVIIAGGFDMSVATPSIPWAESIVSTASSPAWFVLICTSSHFTAVTSSLRRGG